MKLHSIPISFADTGTGHPLEHGVTLCDGRRGVRGCLAVRVSEAPPEEGQGQGQAPAQTGLPALDFVSSDETLEVSGVSIPANPNALVMGVKSGAIAVWDVREAMEMLRCFVETLEGADKARPHPGPLPRGEGENAAIKGGTPAILNLGGEQ